jgi:hypothetical protein
MVCFRYVIVNTLNIGDNKNDDDDDDDDNNNVAQIVNTEQLQNYIH